MERGLIGACMGEWRLITFPPHLGYGERGVGKIISHHHCYCWRNVFGKICLFRLKKLDLMNTKMDNLLHFCT